ncbi:MAG: hypothetical protein WC757_02865 [Candidatus Paceibacterota bacterium]|jgi:hypothetical protein
MNEREINSIIQEVLETEPSCAGKEEFLRTAINELVRFRPQVSIDPSFVAGLRARLMLSYAPIRSPWKIFSFIAIPGVAIVAVILLVLSRGGMVPIVPTNVQPIAVTPTTPAASSVATIPVSAITTLAPEAFGKLAVSFDDAPRLMQKSESASDTSMSVEPTARLMNVQTMTAFAPDPVSEPAIVYVGDEQKISETEGYVFRIKNLVPPVTGMAIYDMEGNRLSVAQVSIEGVSYERSLYSLQSEWGIVVESAVAQARVVCGDVSCVKAEVGNPRRGLVLLEKTDFGNILAPAYVFDAVFDGKKSEQFIVVPLVK